MTAERPITAAGPIDMVLYCPQCGMQHVDGPEAGVIFMQDASGHQSDEMSAVGAWDNPPHRSHLCHGCGHVWRPADVPTNGVVAVTTKGQNDSPVVQQAVVAAVVAEVKGCFESAMVEGLAEALAETTDERLKDLVERRLMYAYYAAERETERPVITMGREGQVAFAEAITNPPPENSAMQKARDSHAQLIAAQPAAEPSALERMRHITNEWADMATNGLQAMRNVAEGISTPAEALESLERNMKHCRAVNDAPGAYGSATPVAAQPARAGGDARMAERVAELEDVLRSVDEQLRVYGDRLPDGFDSRVFRWVKDALAAAPVRAGGDAPFDEDACRERCEVCWGDGSFRPCERRRLHEGAALAAAPAPVRAGGDAPSAEERKLRRMLCAAYSGATAYTDDGEAQDNKALPFIDFLRDSADQIEAKMRERGLAAAPQPAASETDRNAALLAANTDLLTYVLQGDVHNRLTPRVIDIAYTAFMQAKAPNDEDGGPSDWFNDTKPVIEKAIEKLRRDLFAEREARKVEQPAASTVPATVTDEVLWRAAHDGFDNYWTEDSKGNDSEAWLASAKNVLAVAAPAAVEREPLTDEALRQRRNDCMLTRDGYRRTIGSLTGFEMGFRDAERAHGIGSSKESGSAA